MEAATTPERLLDDSVRKEDKQRILAYLRDKYPHQDLKAFLAEDSQAFGHQFSAKRAQAQQFGYDTVRRLLKGKKNREAFNNFLSKFDVCSTPCSTPAKMMPGEQAFQSQYFSSPPIPSGTKPPVKSPPPVPPVTMSSVPPPVTSSVPSVTSTLSGTSIGGSSHCSLIVDELKKSK